IPGVLEKLTHGTRFVLTEHGIFLRELYLSLGRMKESRRCRQFLFGWFESVTRMNYHYADSISSLCEFNRKWQIRMGAAPERIQLIPNGIDSAKFYPPVSRRIGRPPTVLTMARIYPLKGIEYLLQAIGLLRERLPKVRWRIFGEVGD